MLALLSGCGSGGTTQKTSDSNPVPSIAVLAPVSVAAGLSSFTLSVSGNGFVAASAIRWNGATLATTFIGPAQLTASVPAADIASAGNADVTVVNPVPGGGTSNAATFTINGSNPVPSIASLSPTAAHSGGPAFTLTVSGSNFVSASAVSWNGVAVTTTFVSASQLTVSVPAVDLASVGTASITVVNPSPGGGTSNAAAFAIDAAVASAFVRQSAQYNSYPGDNSPSWTVTLQNVQAGSTIYVVGTWPNFVNSYPTMKVTDTALNAYTLLDRHDDTTVFSIGIQGTQSMGHWYAANVSAGSYTINMSPATLAFEDWVGLVAFEVAGVSSAPLDGHTLSAQAGIPPGASSVFATVTTSGSNGILIAVTFDDIDATAPTEQLAGIGFTSLGSLWDFTRAGRPAAGAEFAMITSAGAHTATFNPQEGGAEAPNYMTCAAIFR
jgi:hypothetical protein